MKPFIGNFSEAKLFFKKYTENPKSIGSIIPSSTLLGKQIADVVSALESVPVKEIGAGTGSITRFLEGNNPSIVEIDGEFCEYLQEKFPLLEIINSCALDYLESLSSQVGLVISIPYPWGAWKK
jgi:phospholipid N-methyltransferase